MHSSLQWTFNSQQLNIFHSAKNEGSLSLGASHPSMFSPFNGNGEKKSRNNNKKKIVQNKMAGQMCFPKQKYN